MGAHPVNFLICIVACTYSANFELGVDILVFMVSLFQVDSQGNEDLRRKLLKEQRQKAILEEFAAK